MKRTTAVTFIGDTVRAEVADRRSPPDRDEAWRKNAGDTIDGLNVAAELLRYARVLSADVAHTADQRARRLAEHREWFARLRAWRAAAATSAALLAATADHPFTAEQPEYVGVVLH